MTRENLHFKKRIWGTNQSGRATSLQAAVRLALNILYSEGIHGRRTEVDGALGTERPTRPPTNP